eukprot:scaffold18639_cov57-Phaeocystis_antarctica.AAC.4
MARGRCTPGSARRRGSRPATVTHPGRERLACTLDLSCGAECAGVCATQCEGTRAPRRLRCVRSRAMCGPRERDGRRAARGPGGPVAARSRRRRGAARRCRKLW